MKACAQRRQGVVANRIRQPPPRRSQAHHSNLRLVGQSSRQVRHHRHITLDAGDALQRLARMVGIDHRDDRSSTVSEHGQTGLAGEAGQTTVLEQHQPHLPKSRRRLSPAHHAAVPPAWRIPNPAIAEGRRRSSCNSRPTKGSSTKLRWLSRSGQRIRGKIWAAAPFNNELSE